MSIKQMSQVWEHAATDEPTTLLVLLALADWSNDNGICWPSIASIAEKCRISERSAQRIIKQLEDCGWLEVSRKRGRSHTNTYKLKVPTCQVLFNLTPVIGDVDDTIEEMEKVTSEHEKVTNGALKGDTAMSPEPSEPLVEPSKPSARKTRGGSDARFKPFTDVLHRYWQKFAKDKIPFDLWFGKAGGKQLNNLLQRHDTLTEELFERYLANRARSPNVAHAQPVYEWISRLLDWANGPGLVKFGSVQGNGNGTSKAEQRERERDRKWREFDANRNAPKALPEGSGIGLRPRLESGTDRAMACPADDGAEIHADGNHRGVLGGTD